MKLKIPSKINIGAYEYGIKYRKGMVKHSASTGQCYTSESQIWIDPDELKQTRDVTFFHEAVHCIGDVERINFEEGDIDRLAHCLTRIFNDNFGVEFDWSGIKS